MGNQDEAVSLELAREVYEEACTALDDIGWTYNRDDEELRIRTRVSGDDIPMDIIIEVRPKTGILRVLSYMPFKINEDKAIDAAIACGEVNCRMVNGSFDFDIDDNSIRFRVTTAYLEAKPHKEVYPYMIHLAVNTVDDYNDKFLMISKGVLSIQDFLASFE